MNETIEMPQLDQVHKTNILSRMPTWLRWATGLLLLIIPAMWLPASGDMPSHLYSAWLTHQVENGLQGFMISTQYTYVLTDVLLYWLLPIGPHFAVAVVNVLSVLIFFAGSAFFIRIYATRLPWPCLGLLAMFAYGVLYWMGFTNYIMGSGFGFFALGFGHGTKLLSRCMSLIMLAATFFMHPFVFAWTLGSAFILLVVPRTPARLRLRMYLGSMALSLLPLPFLHRAMFNLWELEQIKSITGADQIYVFGDGSFAVLLVVHLLFASILWNNRKQLRQGMESPLFWLYLMNAAFIFAVPHALTLPSGGNMASNGLPLLNVVGFLTERFAFLQCVLLTAWMATMRWERWQKAVLTAMLCLHCLMAYLTAERVQFANLKLAEIVTQLPHGAKVIADINFQGLRVPVARHLIATGCLGHCYDFANYEPSMGHFRIHALQSNTVVMWRREDVISVESGYYSARPEDLPIYLISPCRTGLCVHSMRPGEPMFIGEIINHNLGLIE